MFTWSFQPFTLFFWHTTSKNATKVRAARAARLYFLIYPVWSLFCDVVVAVALVLAETFISDVYMVVINFFSS